MAPSVTDDDLLAEAQRAVLPGFLTLEQAVERLREVFELGNDDQRPHRVVETVWSRRKAEELTWQGLSDYERLRLAFDELQEQDFVTRMYFADCNTCATAEIDDERTTMDVSGGYPFRESKYTFFHEQDADRLVEDPAVLYLTYSSWRVGSELDTQLVEAARAGDEEARAEVIAQTDAEVGREVVAILRKHGLEVTWDGDYRKRLAVAIRSWHKPLPA